MLSSLIITLREGIEGALAVAIVFLYLRKTGRPQLIPAVWWGLGAAVLASIGGAFLLQQLPVNSEIFEGAMMFAAAVFVATMIAWMWRTSRRLKGEIEARVEELASRTESGTGGGAWLGLFLFTFLMVVREGMETVVFLSAVNFTSSALLSFFGGIIGLTLAVLFGFFFVRGSIRVDLGRFFKITGIVLLLFVVQLIIGGIHELGEGGAVNLGPEAMAIIGPVVKNNALFLIGVLLIPVLLLVVPATAKRNAVPPPVSAGAAAGRLELARLRRQKQWRAAAAALSIFIVLFIGYDFVYGQSKERLSSAQTVTPVNGQVAIAVASVSDGTLHRFVLAGSPVRFFVMREPGGKLAAAFDACEICGSKGYIQKGSSVVCLNCQSDININSLGQGGGCNPIPLRFTEQGQRVVIRVADLQRQDRTFRKG